LVIVITVFSQWSLPVRIFESVGVNTTFQETPPSTVGVAVIFEVLVVDAVAEPVPLTEIAVGS